MNPTVFNNYSKSLANTLKLAVTENDQAKLEVNKGPSLFISASATPAEHSEILSQLNEKLNGTAKPFTMQSLQQALATTPGIKEIKIQRFPDSLQSIAYVETVNGKKFKFAVSLDKNMQNVYFSTNPHTIDQIKKQYGGLKGGVRTLSELRAALNNVNLTPAELRNIYQETLNAAGRAAANFDLTILNGLASHQNADLGLLNDLYAMAIDPANGGVVQNRELLVRLVRNQNASPQLLDNVYNDVMGQANQGQELDMHLLSELVDHPNALPHLFENIYNDVVRQVNQGQGLNMEILDLLAGHPNVDFVLLNNIFNIVVKNVHPGHELYMVILVALAGHENADTQLLNKIASEAARQASPSQGLNMDLLVALAGNESAAPLLLNEIYDDLMWRASQGQGLEMGVLDILAANRNADSQLLSRIRTGAANGGVVQDMALLATLAGRQNATPQLLNALYNDVMNPVNQGRGLNLAILAILAANPNADSQLLTDIYNTVVTIANQGRGLNLDLLAILAENPNADSQLLTNIYTIITNLANHGQGLEMAILARVAANPNADSQLLTNIYTTALTNIGGAQAVIQQAQLNVDFLSILIQIAAAGNATLALLDSVFTLVQQWANQHNQLLPIGVIGGLAQNASSSSGLLNNVYDSVYARANPLADPATFVINMLIYADAFPLLAANPNMDDVLSDKLFSFAQVARQELNGQNFNNNIQLNLRRVVDGIARELITHPNTLTSIREELGGWLDNPQLILSLANLAQDEPLVLLQLAENPASGSPTLNFIFNTLNQPHYIGRGNNFIINLNEPEVAGFQLLKNLCRAIEINPNNTIARQTIQALWQRAFN